MRSHIPTPRVPDAFWSAAGQRYLTTAFNDAWRDPQAGPIVRNQPKVRPPETRAAAAAERTYPQPRCEAARSLSSLLGPRAGGGARGRGGPSRPLGPADGDGGGRAGGGRLAAEWPPLFMAAERARLLAAEKAPYGLAMGDKSAAQATARIREYQRNTSQPARCRYASCAVVGSGGALRGARYGAAIDAHEAVIRVNAAPTVGHETAVGARTTWRVHNSEKPFMLAAAGVPELQLVICHMGWIGACQHQAFSGAYMRSVAYVNPLFYLELWKLLGTPKGTRSNAPSAWRHRM